jgi:hypothetical protein
VLFVCVFILRIENIYIEDILDRISCCNIYFSSIMCNTSKSQLIKGITYTT